MSSGTARGRRANPYQVEHDLLFEAIREDKPYNEADRSAKAAMAGILGRMAAESGKGIAWDEAIASNLELAPGLDAVHDGVESAGDARRPGPLPDRHAGDDEGPVIASGGREGKRPSRRSFTLNWTFATVGERRGAVLIPSGRGDCELRLGKSPD